MLGMPETTVDVRLRGLHSVLDVPDRQESGFPARLLHPSFRDFLLDKERSLNHHVWIDEEKAHGDLCANSLNLMSKHLRTDNCNLRLPGILIHEVEDGVV